MIESMINQEKVGQINAHILKVYLRSKQNSDSQQNLGPSIDGSYKISKNNL